MFCPDAVAAYAASLRTGRATRRDGRLALRSLRSVSETKTKDVFKIKGLAIRQLLNQLAHEAHVHLLRFADLVVMAGRLQPFPFRTRP